MKIIKKMFIIAMAAVMLLAMASCGKSNVGGTPVDEMSDADVKAIILEKVPGATEADIYEFEKDYDDGRVEYEGSLYYDGYEYEFEIDGTNGNVLKWEIDREGF